MQKHIQLKKIYIINKKLSIKFNYFSETSTSNKRGNGVNL